MRPRRPRREPTAAPARPDGPASARPPDRSPTPAGTRRPAGTGGEPGPEVDRRAPTTAMGRTRADQLGATDRTGGEPASPVADTAGPEGRRACGDHGESDVGERVSAGSGGDGAGRGPRRDELGAGVGADWEGRSGPRSGRPAGDADGPGGGSRAGRAGMRADPGVWPGPVDTGHQRLDVDAGCGGPGCGARRRRAAGAAPGGPGRPGAGSEPEGRRRAGRGGPEARASRVVRAASDRARDEGWVRQVGARGWGREEQDPSARPDRPGRGSSHRRTEARGAGPGLDRGRCER
jgi:hypothetical protein